MSLVPGAAGDKAVFPDGIQVDHISENTVGHGSRVRGISDPTTYPVISGDIGETIEASATVATNTAGVSFTVTSLLLPQGKWSLSAHILQGAATAVYTWLRDVTAYGGTSGKNLFNLGTSTIIRVTPFAPQIITLTTPTTYYLCSQYDGASNIDTKGYMVATRIA